MLASPVNGEEQTIALTALFGELDLLFAAEILSRDRILALQQLVHRAGKYYITAVYACARADVNDVVCREHCIVIVLNDNQCVAEVAQSFEGRDKLVIVTLVQTDAWFVKNVENSDKR